MSTATPEQVAALEQVLADRERELLAGVARLRTAMTEPSGATGPDVRDRGDAGAVDTGLARELTDLDRSEREIGEINAARLRMREGTYGFCEDCGADIPYERLKAVPTARYCLQDEARRERLAAHGAG